MLTLLHQSRTGLSRRVRPLAWLFIWLAGFAQADNTTTEYTVEQVQEELHSLYAQLQSSHYDLYARRSKAEYDLAYQAALKDISAPHSLAAIMQRFQRFVAYGNVAHAKIDFPAQAYAQYREQGGKTFPLYFQVKNGRIYVVGNYSGHALPALGDELVQFETDSAPQFLRKVRQPISADTDYLANTQLEWQWPAMIWLQYGSLAQFTLRFLDKDQNPYTQTISARTRPEIIAAVAQHPPSLELDMQSRVAKVLDNGIAYLRPGPFYNVEGKAEDVWDVKVFKHFMDQSFNEFIQKKSPALLIDLRNNPGGDNSFSDLMVNWFAHHPYRFCSSFTVKVSEAAIAATQARLPKDAVASDTIASAFDREFSRHALGEKFPFIIPLAIPKAERFTGQVFILINRHSYSNTVMVAALAQDNQFATLMGEETADLASTYGAMEQFTLPTTGIKVSFPKAYMTRPNGSTNTRGVIPDIVIDTPLLEDPEDPVLHRALNIIHAKLGRSAK